MKFLLLKAVCFLFLSNLFLMQSPAGAWTFFCCSSKWQKIVMFTKYCMLLVLPVLGNLRFFMSTHYFHQLVLHTPCGRSQCNGIIISSLCPGFILTHSFSSLPVLWSLSSKARFFRANPPNIKSHLTPKGLQAGGSTLYHSALNLHLRTDATN